MSFYCQKHSYEKELTTKVVSCTPTQLKLEVNGKKQNVKGFELILEDTVLFPEGGGQPDDRGMINETEVLRITRRGADAVHFVTTPFESGSEVIQKVDWRRRFDHMQQHSGQHLVTAIADNKFGWKTTSWDLGREKSFIELDTPKIPADQMEELERDVNDAIRRCVAMTPRWVQPESKELQDIRSRALPDDHEGLIRIVEIEGIDANTCCGTHVSNLSHLQAIKLLGAEKGKKGKTNLYYLAGDRVLAYLGKCYNNEKALNNSLRCGLEDHVQQVDKVQKSLKAANKNCLTLLRELALLEARRYRDAPDRDPVLSLHRKEGDSEYMNMVANEVGSENALILLSVGEENGAGLFLVAGPPEIIEEAGPKVASLLEGKGACKNGRYQGKAAKLSKRTEAEQLLREFTQKLNLNK